jgi:hypothetical protein
MCFLASGTVCKKRLERYVFGGIYSDCNTQKQRVFNMEYYVLILNVLPYHNASRRAREPSQGIGPRPAEELRDDGVLALQKAGNVKSDMQIAGRRNVGHGLQRHDNGSMNKK